MVSVLVKTRSSNMYGFACDINLSFPLPQPTNTHTQNQRLHSHTNKLATWILRSKHPHTMDEYM
jgi:hypothetical protein